MTTLRWTSTLALVALLVSALAPSAWARSSKDTVITSPVASSDGSDGWVTSRKPVFTVEYGDKAPNKVKCELGKIAIGLPIEKEHSTVRCVKESKGTYAPVGKLKEGKRYQLRMATVVKGKKDPTPAKVIFKVDTIAPVVTLSSGGPSGLDGDYNPVWNFTTSEPGKVLHCSFFYLPQRGLWQENVCSSVGGPFLGFPEVIEAQIPGTTFKVGPELQAEQYDFVYYATDLAGNTSREQTINFAIHPDTLISDLPMPDSAVAFGFRENVKDQVSLATRPEFQCRVWNLSGAAPAFETCTSPYVPASLVAAPGQGKRWRFEVRLQTEGITERVPAFYEWNIDVPDTTITSSPFGVIFSNNVTYQFTSDIPGSDFMCRGFVHNTTPPSFAPCTSPHVMSAPLTSTTYDFEVKAIAPGGLEDPTPATHSFVKGNPT